VLAPVAVPVPVPSDADPAEGVVTIRTSDPEWTGKLARMLRDTRQDAPVWTGPHWKKSWYWGCQWGCLDLSAVAEGSGDTWVIPHTYAEFLGAAAATVEAVTAERRRCSRCGAAVARRVGWADVDTSAGWESLCASCLATHDSSLREYDGQLRDIPYARARYRQQNPATLYRCALCAQPAVVWDHCHEHGYIRGPLCRECNMSDHWLFRVPYRLERFPIDHAEQCKGCARTQPNLGIHAAIVRYWIGSLATPPIGHDHPQMVELSAYPNKQSIRDAIEQQTYAVEPVAWTCRECEESWEQQIDPERILVVISRVMPYLHTGDITLITGNAEEACAVLRPVNREVLAAGEG
jgi:hypothetical protein